MFFLLISFVGGVLTVLAPCILPLLPIIIGGSLGDSGVNKKKAITIVTALGVSVIAFTLLLKVAVLFIAIPEYVWRYLSGGILALFGLVTLFPALWEGQVLARINARSNILVGMGTRKKSFIGDIIVGAALGPVFSTCSPTYFIVLATVLPARPLLGLVYMFAYAIGLCLALLLISLLGQRLVERLGYAADPSGRFKRALGALFIIVGIGIMGGFDKRIQIALLDLGFFDVTRIEQRLLQINEAKNR